MPLLLDFHGFTMTAEEQRQYSRWDAVAEREGFLAVWPEGVADAPSELRSWNINDEAGRYGPVCDRDRQVLWQIGELTVSLHYHNQTILDCVSGRAV